MTTTATAAAPVRQSRWPGDGPAVMLGRSDGGVPPPGEEVEVATCATCRQAVTPGAPGVVRAVELLYEQDFGGEPAEPAEGATVYFHRDHVPAATSHLRILG